MRRGDICIADLDPHVGSEASKSRPVVVVSNDGANIAVQRSGRGVVTVVPLTSNTERVHPFQVLLPADATGLGHASKAQAEQVRSVSAQRLGPVVATLPSLLVEQLDEALRLHLAL
ncbi:MAG: type II toxin-antitoxin system PemK/MazF family toxin [Actinomycetota bacterium]|nr:type II toxin-antitoxin system PemK/MazF family toxin [Actinomycetota bacterium]